MKVLVISSNGAAWEFDSVKQARPHLKKDWDYEIETDPRDGKKTRVYKSWIKKERENYE